MTTPSPSEKLTGYVTPRRFGPFAMPVPAQNSCLREYAATMGFAYAQPQCEHIFENCYVQLFGTLNGAPAGGHIVMYSFHMLPEVPRDLQKLMEIVQEKKLTLHFVLEKKTLKAQEELREMLKVRRIANIARSNAARKASIAQQAP
jgi:sporadic carbohydrate cluster protein (TIGR04323 family)